MTRVVVLAARPHGEPRETDFELRDEPDPSPGDGEVLVRNVFVSVDPYMRGRMTAARSYVAPFELGQPITGGTVGRVAASRDDRFQEGDWVRTFTGWREVAVVQADHLEPVDPELGPPCTALGVLGMPGFTAWIGLVEIGRIEAGETVYVSAAAGAVGSMAVQIAKLRGCRVIGSAGTPAKVEWLRSLGIEAFDYHETAPADALGDGIDVYFDNIGGDHLEAALGALRPFGRVVACGAISRYNATEPEPGPRNLFVVVGKRLRIQGFIVSDHQERFAEFLAEVAPRVGDGTIQYRETILEGIERIPEAFAGLFSGDNIGKMLVRVSPEEA